MSIKSIEAEELREMTGKEGLILQGCGGPLQEWLDGINDMLTEAGRTGAVLPTFMFLSMRG